MTAPLSETDPPWIGQWLTECARYFRKRKTGGEDSAHWSNVYNAENCEKILAHILQSREEVERLTKDVRKYCNSTRDAEVEAQINRNQREAAEARVTTLEAENARLRAALEEIIGAYDGYRGKGYLPAPDEYQRMVGAINRARVLTEPRGDA